jgi:bifunctional DNA-binding transcriptional regulator/antitoxin component of YhaV-PrlF toxin-antitoxin module
MATGNGWGGESSGSKPLVGKALLDRARSLSNRPEEQIARACGYVGPSGRVLRKSFYRALVEAKGYQLPSSSTPSPGGGSSSGGSSGAGKGRQAEYRTRVHGNGNLLIGHAYTRRMGLEPGDEFHIELHPETGAIWLVPLEPGEASAIAQQLLEDGSELDDDDNEEDTAEEDTAEEVDEETDEIVDKIVEEIGDEMVDGEGFVDTNSESNLNAGNGHQSKADA